MSGKECLGAFTATSRVLNAVVRVSDPPVGFGGAVRIFSGCVVPSLSLAAYLCRRLEGEPAADAAILRFVISPAFSYNG